MIWLNGKIMTHTMELCGFSFKDSFQDGIAVVISSAFLSYREDQNQ